MGRATGIATSSEGSGIIVLNNLKSVTGPKELKSKDSDFSLLRHNWDTHLIILKMETLTLAQLERLYG